jgi:WD40 repeat protein
MSYCSHSGLTNTYSSDTTVRTFLLPSLQPHLVLRSHRAAVNALALSEGLIASASGDRSLRIWDAETGDLVHVYDGHHGRG